MTYVTANNQSCLITPSQNSYKQRLFSILWEEIRAHLEVSKLFRNQALKPPRTSTFKLQEHSKQTYPILPPRSQSALKLSSKASKNSKKPQISEALQIQASQAPEELRPQIFECKEIHPNHHSKSQSFIGIKFQSLQKLQEL